MMQSEPMHADADVTRLIAEAGLPVSDLAGGQGLELLGLREGGTLVGVIGLQVLGAVGLLRSLAVSPGRRGAGFGTTLVSDAEALAARVGIGTLYLLTTTAAPFFARLGYETIPRSGAPAAIAGTTQFAELCPVSSIFMRKVLGAGASGAVRRL